MKRINKAAIVFTLLFIASLGLVGKVNASIINTLNITIQNPPTPPTPPKKPEPPLPPNLPTPTPKATSTPVPTSNTTSTSTSGGGGSAPSCNAAKPGTPVIYSEIRKGTSEILTWSSVPNATYYSIIYGEINGQYPYGVPNTGNVTSYTINDLKLGTAYHFKVNAVNDCMPGDSGVLGSGQVLGASTMAGTGTFEQNIFLAIMGFGGIISLFGIKNFKKAFSKA
ncbi:MAG: fibronectin type III domain-containing protein [Candidatus Microgenomates bacterium]|jgi:hypothetical protein